jgi:hypothetical protein
MRRWRRSARAACGAAVFVLCCPAVLSAAPPCDEYDPFGPARSVQLRLGAGDFVDEHRDEMSSFIATESIGRVDVAVVSSQPRGVVRAVSAVPQISAYSPHRGEQLKGIHVAVSLANPGANSGRPVSVVLDLRQVCAKHFRHTFLYY